LYYLSGNDADGMEPTDETLVQRCLNGDTEAFDALVRRYQRPIYNLAYRLTSDPEEANDLAQEIFLRVYERLHTFQPEAAFRPWLYRVATNWCLNALKRRRPPTVSLETGGGIEGEERPLELPDLVEDPARLAERRELQERVQQAILTLPPKYRIVMLLRYAQGLSYEEIATALEMPLGTVKIHLHRAKAHLKERLRDLYEAYFG